MLTFSRLGRKGNLGNQLFQIASTVGLATKNNHGYCFPEWKYNKYFHCELPKCINNFSFCEVEEKQFSYYEWDLREDDDYDLNGWLQSEKYFERDLTRKLFEFKHDFLKDLGKRLGSHLKRRPILITVRRGVFVNNPDYYQLSYQYYFLALLKNFPDWRERNLIFTSDDISYCQKHFGFLPNAYFLKDYSPIEQLAIGSMCDDFIISNSTFSWWIAWLGEKPGSIVIRPKKYLRGKFSRKNSDQDFFPERWKSFDHHQFSIPRKHLKLFLYGETYQFFFNCNYYRKYYLKKILKKLRRMLTQNSA